MKFMHLSDLHLGRLLHRYSLQEEQAELLARILKIAAAEKPDAVLIAGDIYDRSIPPVYATQLLDSFLASLSRMTKVFLISGNHDSAERLAFLCAPLSASGLHISPVYTGHITPVTLEDDNGPVDIWLLPFLKAASVRPFFSEESIENTNDAVACAIQHMNIDPNRRNVLVAHQFVAGGTPSGSEENFSTRDVSVGGSDMVYSSTFAPFDYVALGHIHRAQSAGNERIRYSGTPMAYDFSEAGSEKGVTIVELAGDRSLCIRTVSIPAPRNLVEIRGAFNDITSDDFLQKTDRDAYTHITLTDDAPIPDVMNRLRQAYPHITHLDWDNARTRQTDEVSCATIPKQTPMSIFAEFYQRMGGTELLPEQTGYLENLIRQIWEDNA